MPLTVAEIDERIEALQEGLDSVSEVSFEGETTKYRSVGEIKRAIAYYSKLKQGLEDTPKGRYRSFNFKLDRGL